MATKSSENRKAEDPKVATYLRKRREELQLELVDIAEVADIALSTISRIELGVRSIPKDRLPVFAKAYRIPFFTLLSLIYEGKVPKIDTENALPHFKRVMDAGITSFSFMDLIELLDTEESLGFVIEPEQLKAWYSKRSSANKCANEDA